MPIFIDAATIARAAARRQAGFILSDETLCYFTWNRDDPLGPVMLAQFGGYPDAAEGYPDYVTITRNAGNPPGSVRHIGTADPIPADGMRLNTPITLTMLGLSTIKPMEYAGNFPGIYAGDASSFADVVSFWNLKAAGLRLAFFDPRHSDRMSGFRDRWLDALKARPRSRWPEVYDRVSLWLGSNQKPDDLGLDLEHPDWRTFDEFTFATLNTQPCVVVGPGQGILATVSDTDGRPVAALQLPERPFASEEPLAGLQLHMVGVQYPWEYGLPEEYTLSVPYVPALNRSLGLECGLFANNVRSDLNDIGVVVEANRDSLTLGAVNRRRYAEAFFQTMGIEATPSRPGLVAARVIGQMGGLQGCRVLKIAGVRSLLRKFGPSETFTRGAAEKLIGEYDEENRVMRFDQYDKLTIDRDQGGKLTPHKTFDYLLTREVLQVGLEFKCPSCSLTFWKHLDEARVLVTCEYCRRMFDVSRQLKDRDWRYRRSGVFGRGDSQLGAIPVVLVMQQLHTHMHDTNPIILPSMELTLGHLTTCETDLVVLNQLRGTILSRSPQIQVALGECKTTDVITRDDSENLLGAAHILEKAGYETFIIFAKLAEFTPEDVNACRVVNEKHRQRAVLLGPAELEPYWMPDVHSHNFLEHLADIADKRYFCQPEPGP